MYETSIGIIVFRIKNGKIKFLLMQRFDNQMWDLPKGHYSDDEKKETEIEVARREVEEETQISEVKFVKGFRYTYSFINPKDSHRQIIMFLGETTQEPTISKEHSEYRWMNFECACKLLAYDEKIKMMNAAKAYLLEYNYRL